MSKSAYFGKPLKGISTIAPSISDAVTNDVVSNITSGTIDFGTVTITGGTLNGVTIGNSSPGVGYFNYLQVDGSVLFYGVDPSFFAQWEPNSNTWQIQGNLVSTGISNLGNFSISGNTISTINTNGPINLTPNGTGGIFLNGPLQQSTTNGNISFLTTNGIFNVNTSSNISINSSSGSLSLTSGTNATLSTRSGDITLRTGTSIPSFTITAISTGVSTVQVTTSLANNFVVGDEIRISNTNSTPTIDGVFTVASIINPQLFTVAVSSPVTIAGNQGSVREVNKLILQPTDYISIPSNIPTYYGATCNSIQSDTNTNLSISTCGSILLNPTNTINVPANRDLIFANTNNSISSNGTNLSISNTGGSVLINGDTSISGNLTVTGTQTIVNSQVVVVQDPVFALGGQTATSVNDGMDRGILYRYGTGVDSKLGFFGYQRAADAFVFIPDAIENNNVVTGNYGDAIFNRLTILEGEFQGSITATSLTGDPDLTFTSRNTFLNSTGYVRVSEATPVYYGTSLNNSISGQGNTLSITGGTTIDLNASSRINIPSNTFVSFNGTNTGSGLTYTNTQFSIASASPIFLNTTEVQMSTNTPLFLNTAKTTSIRSDLSNNLVLQSAGNLLLNTSQYAILPANTSILFSDTNNAINHSASGISIFTNNTLNMTGSSVAIASNNDINLTPTGSVIVPTSKSLAFGSTDFSISSNGTNLNISSSNNINLNPISLVVVGTELSPKCMVFGFTTESICPSSRSLVISANQNILLNPSAGHVLLNYDKQLKWTNELVYGSTSGLIMSSPTAIRLTNTGSADIFLTPNMGVFIPFNRFLYFGDTNSSVVSDTSNNMSIFSSGRINVNSSLGTLIEAQSNLRITTSSVFLNQNAIIHFNSTTESIYSGTGNQLFVAANGSLRLSGSSILLETSNVRTNDAILSLGGVQAPVAAVSQDKGVEFYWYDTNVSTSKLGFFGYKHNTGVFTFIPDGVNTAEVFTGTPGNVLFGNISGTAGTLTSLNLSNGGITNLSTITTNSLEFVIPTFGNILIPNNVYLNFGSTNIGVYSDGTNLHIANTTGDLIVDSDAQIDGSLTVNSLTINGNAPYIALTEHVNAIGGASFTLDWNKALTFITVSGSGIATCIAQPSTGFIKTIVITSMSATASVNINFTSGTNSRLKDPGSGAITSDGVLRFDTAGQSIQLIYDAYNQYWLTVNGGCYYS
jgi:hypothetical protein